MTDKKNEGGVIKIYGYTRSLQLLVIFLICFLGMLFIFVDAVVSRAYPYMVVAVFGTIVGFFGFAVIWGIVRYFSEQIIALVSANVYRMSASEEDEDEGEGKAEETA